MEITIKFSRSVKPTYMTDKERNELIKNIQEAAYIFIAPTLVPGNMMTKFLESCLMKEKGRKLSASERDLLLDGFMAGYRAAVEWISVKDRLPDNDRAVLVKDERTNAVWTSNMVDGRIVPLEATLIDIIEATHWREIEIPK
jgi:hypothetical protein